MTDSRTENARTLASLLGIDTREASERLNVTVAVTADPTDVTAMTVAVNLQDLLSRTLTDVRLNSTSASVSAELVVGAAAPTSTEAIRVHVSPDVIRIGKSVPARGLPEETHPLLLLIAACYASGAVLKSIFGATLQVPGAATSVDLTIPTSVMLGPDPSWLTREFELTDTYVAGAGAIGNGFFKALCLLRVSGSLMIVDPDTVTDGSLNRCVWFSSADIGLSKADRLAQLAQPSCPRLVLVPNTATLQHVGKSQTTDNWLRRLIVAVDSRRTRRHLQHELPGEVFDASTTGAVECVLHHHAQPNDAACLACIYHETADELAREQHMADTLGVHVHDVMQHFVSGDAARKIHEKYPHVPLEALAGQAYDTLFKALCSEGMLISPGRRQVLAPFAFVSVLAGTLLAIELGRRLTLGGHAHDFNYWRVSPWAPPVADLKSMRARVDGCDFCSQPALLRTARSLWTRRREAG